MHEKITIWEYEIIESAMNDIVVGRVQDSSTAFAKFHVKI